MLDFFIILICIALFISFIEFIKSVSLSTKVVAFDVMSIMAVCLLVLLSITYKNSLYLDIAFVFALIGFLGVIIFSRFNILFKESEDA